MEWKKMSVIAHELGVSKDVIKYHRKRLDPRFYKKIPSGEILISPEGITYIQSKLRKERYNQDFEEYTKYKLRLLEANIERMNDLLINKLIIAPSIKKGTDISKQETFASQLKNKLDDQFVTWYCEKEKIDEWADWRWDFVKLSDILLYLETSA